MFVLRHIGEVCGVLHSILGGEEQDVIFWGPLVPQDCKAEPALRNTCPQALLTVGRGSGWVRRNVQSQPVPE